MAAAAAAAPTGMTAILGGDPAAVEAALARHELTAANVNAAGQVVAAGPVAGLDQLAADPPAGARLRPLSVAGAFHTAAMEPARVELARLAAGVPVRDPYTTFVSNADGAVVTSGRDLLRRLVDQVSSPVRWDLCMRTLGELGVTAVVELPPAGTLTALIRRAMPEVTTLAIRTPDDLAAARQLVAEHQPVIGEPGPPWRVVVAPLAGTFRADALPTGARLAAGALLGTIESRREVVPVAAAQPGVLVEWLAHDGDPVDPGQPLVRVHPEALAR
jgi:[acyl-carrier-protein] S-malonyltransferase